jgi:hypothetical protein
VHVTLHAPAQRRIELCQVADFHYLFVIPREVEESLLLPFFTHRGIKRMRDASTPLSMTRESAQQLLLQFA